MYNIFDQRFLPPHCATCSGLGVRFHRRGQLYGFRDLNKKELVAGDVSWILPKKLPLNAEVKIRYKSDFTKAKILNTGKNPSASLRAGKVKVIFVKPQKAITPGQSAVFYKGKELLGGGVIM